MNTATLFNLAQHVFLCCLTIEAVAAVSFKISYMNL